MSNSKTFIHAKHVILNLFQDLVNTTASVKIFLFGFLLCFLSEGLGFLPKHIVFPLFLLFSVFLGILLLRSKSPISVHGPWIFIAACLYVLYLLYLSFFSLNAQISFEFTVFLLSLLVLFVVVSKKWDYIEKPFLYSLLGLGIFFCLYSLFFIPYMHSHLSFLYPAHGYQYVYTLFGSNHLGEFLVFPLLLSFSFYIQQKRKGFLYLFFFYLVFFLFSYSRAAYIGFLVGFLLLCINLRHFITKRQKRMSTALFVIVISFFTLISTYAIWKDTMPVFSEILQLNPKSAVEVRESYIGHGLKGFNQYSFHGVGLHNFEYASRMFTEIPDGWTSSSHNIFIDVLTETGTIGFVIFVLFSIILLRTIKNHHQSIFAVLLLSWFTMAQFDYIHQMYSYLLLFPFFLVGLIKSVQLTPRSFSEVGLKLFVLILSFSLFLFLSIYIFSSIFLYKGNYQLSRTIYPLQQRAYTKDLDQKDVLFAYTQLFSGEQNGWLLRAERYEKEKNMPRAIDSYEIAFWLDPFRDLLMAEKIYSLKQKYPGNGSEKIFAEKLFKKLSNDTGQKVLSYEQWLFANKFCQKVYNLHCIYTLE